jgi:DegV family protein with EDD domain
MTESKNPPYIISAENTSDMPKEFYEANGVPCGKLAFTIGGKTYLDLDDAMTIEDFYRQIRQGEMPVTSLVNVDQAGDILESIIKQGFDVLHIGFSSALSGTFNSFSTAAEELREKYPARKIVLVDSLQASMGQGLLLQLALKNRDAGMSLEENTIWVEENKFRIAAWFTVDDLNHLHRGGRLSKTSAVMGSMLGIKPVLFIDNEGRLHPAAKVRGQKAALTKLLDKMEQIGVDLSNHPIYISHSDAKETVETFIEMMNSRFGIKRENITTGFIGPIIGAHTGPGTVAVFFQATSRE